MNKEELLEVGKPILFNQEMVIAVLNSKRYLPSKIYKVNYKHLPEEEILLMRIINGIEINKKTNCWEWQRAKNIHGYGTITINRATRTVYREMYKLINGEITDELHVLHDCDNPSCCNPKHLHLGTISDNMKECYDRGRSKLRPVSLRGTKNPNHKITELDVIKIRNKYQNGLKQIEIAKIFNISQTQVSDIVNYKAWKQLGGCK